MIVFVFVIGAVIVYEIYSFFSASTLRYLESSGEVDGQWVDLPIRGDKFRGLSSIAFGNGRFEVLGKEESFLLLTV